MFTEEKIADFRQILANAAPERIPELESVIAGRRIEMFTDEQVQSKIAELQKVCEDFYFPKQAEVVLPQGIIDDGDLASLEDLCITYQDRGKQWELFKNGESVYWIAKDIDKTDFKSILLNSI